MPLVTLADDPRILVEILLCRRMDLGNSGDTYDRRDHTCTSIQTEILYELSPSWQIDNLTTRDHTVLLGTYQTKPNIHAKGKTRLREQK